jgi:DNA-binding MarR family transcriptional regulator
MSNAILNKAWEQDLPSGPKFVLVALSDQSNDNGVCWPSIPQIAKRCGLDVRSVSRSLAKLEQMGLIERDVLQGRGTTYRLVFINQSAETPLTNCHATPDKLSSLPLTNCPEPLTNCHATPDKLSSKPSVTISNHQEQGKLRVSQEPPQQEKQQRGSRLPADWNPSDVDFQFCKTERPDLDPEKTADRFRDYWISQPGAKGIKLNWPATWRNWVRNETRSASQPPKKNQFAGIV